MAKVPQPGSVKTRLIGALGEVHACALHQAMLLVTLDIVRQTHLPCTVALAGDLSNPLTERLRDGGFQVEAQQGANLGERLAHATRGDTRVVAVGSDCVCFSPRWLIDAADAVQPISLGPTDDGGYWAIAVQGDSARRAAFTGIPWSTDAVHRTTLANASAAALQVHPLPACYDIDRPSDLKRLQQDVRCPPEIRALLDSWCPTSP